MSEIFLTTLERKLIEEGYNSFSLSDKNGLVIQLADSKGIAYTQITEEVILNHHKELKINILSETCDNTITEGFIAENGHRYRTNRDDQLNMVAKNIQLLQNPSITEVHWKTEDAGYVLHTREEWLKVYSEGITHKETNLYKYNTLKIQVKNALSDDEVLAVAWA